MSVRNVVGSPVVGEDFFDREVECARIFDRLATDDVLLPSPRRVGKTSVLRKIEHEAPARGYRAAFFADVGAAKTEREVVGKLLAAVAARPEGAPVVRRVEGGPFRNVVRRVRRLAAGGVAIELADLPRDRWEELGRDVVLALRAAGGPWLLAIDELGIAVQNLLRRDPSGARARHFLEWFRDDLRLAAPGGPRPVRFVVASSVGLSALADLHNLADTINDFYRVPLDAFPPDVADRFLSALAAGRGVPMALPVRRRIVERVEWAIPYFLQLFFARLVETCGGRAPVAEDVDDVFEGLLGDVHYRRYLDWWSQRLEDELGKARARFAIRPLSICAWSPDGASRSVLERALADDIADEDERRWARSKLLDLLCGDGYLVEAGERLRFRSALVREYWRRKHGRP